MRALTLLVTSKPGATPEQLMRSIAEANQTRVNLIELAGPLCDADLEILQQANQWQHEIRSNQAKANTFIDSLLVTWLAEAAGTEPSDVVRRLALAVETLLPPR